VPVVRIAIITTPISGISPITTPAPAVVAPVTAPAPSVAVVAGISPVPAVIAPGVVKAIAVIANPGVTQAISITAPAPAVVNIYGYTGGIVSPAAISLISIVGIIIIIRFGIQVQTVLGCSRRITVYIGEYFTIEYFPVFFGLLPEIVTIYIVVILCRGPLLGLRVVFYRHPSGIICIDPIVRIIGSLLVGTAGNHKQARQQGKPFNGVFRVG
jgi:hypothetical protein